MSGRVVQDGSRGSEFDIDLTHDVLDAGRIGDGAIVFVFRLTNRAEDRKLPRAFGDTEEVPDQRDVAQVSAHQDAGIPLAPGAREVHRSLRNAAIVEDNRNGSLHPLR